MTDEVMKLKPPASAFRYFMSLAKLASGRSPHPRFKHGAVIVQDTCQFTYNDTVPVPVSIGYNRVPRRIRNEAAYWEIGKDYQGWTIHAEEDALLRGGKDCYAGHLMVCTGLPCPRCLLRILDSGITLVIYGDESYQSKESDLLITRQVVGIGVGLRLFELKADNSLVELAHV